jgi:glucose/arabinose dehydrogenase
MVELFKKELFMKVLVKIVVFLSVLSFSYLNAKEIKTQTIISNLTIPWGMTFIDEDKMLITQRDGKVFLLDILSKKLASIKNPPKVFVYRQGGLLDIKVSPNFTKDGWIYLTYVKELDGKGVTTLARMRLKGDEFYSFEDLLITKSASKTGAHFGSRITFDEDGYLYFSIGDRGIRANGQDINTHAGSILRLHLDGRIPDDNPFVKKDGLDEIYSYGHRNPQGVFYDKLTKQLFINEHGPRGGDEINIIKKAKNYGWATISHGKEYWAPIQVGIGTHKEGMEQAIKVFTPSIAPSSLMVYSGKIYKNYKGNLFSGALALTHLNRIVLDKNNKVVKEERLLESLSERIRNVVESPKGFIYLSTDSGKILRLLP